jgi:hypothetical protein
VGEESVLVFHSRGGEREQGKEEPPLVHGGIKRDRDDAMGSQLKRPNLAPCHARLPKKKGKGNLVLILI